MLELLNDELGMIQQIYRHSTSAWYITLHSGHKEKKKLDI